MSAAPLPNGGLQLFYDAITDNAFPQDGFVWTRWQPSDQQGPGKVDVTVGDWRRVEVVHFA